MILTSLLLSLLGGNETSIQSPALNLGGSGIGGVSSVFPFSSVNLQLNDNPIRQSRTLDPRYRLQWETNRKESRIYFNVTAETRGYIGFGLSKKGKMLGADIVIGGVDSNGKPYFSDRHVVRDQIPVLDKIQSYILHEAYEQGTVTFLSFSRPFNTCDEDDLEINERDLVSVIWAYSEKDDELQYHFENRGSYEIYLLDINFSPRNFIDNYQGRGTLPSILTPSSTSTAANLFQIRQQRTLPRQDTFYYCSFHLAPSTTKQHIIGFNTDIPSDSRPLIHHLLLYRCQTPDSNATSTLSQASKNGGGECYLGNNVGPPGVSLCREEIYAWAVGGLATFFPPHVGVPMSESGAEYFMLQVHYDNPDPLLSLNVSLSLDIYYTSNLRQNDLGMLLVGNAVPSATSLVIPPYSKNHVINGHCASGCTERILPPNGIRVISALGHTHLTGRQVKLRIFREGKELPWIGADDNYNFDFQQIRLLREEKRILPGDQLIASCTFDTTERNGTVVTGGYATREEMCLMHLYYYGRVPGVGNCLSEIREESYMDFLKIWNTTFVSTQRETVVTQPVQVRGLSVSNYLTNLGPDWNLKFRKELQQHHLFQPQISVCPTPTTPISPIGDLRNRFVQGFNPVKGYENPAKLRNYKFKRSIQSQSGFAASQEEESRLSQGIVEYQPESKCGWGYQAPEIVNDEKQEEIDLRIYPDYDEERNLENNQVEIDVS